MNPQAVRQFLVLLACSGGLIALLAQANHELSFLALTLATPGLLVVYSALRLPLLRGLSLVCLTGLLLDAAAPIPFGSHAFLLGLGFCALHGVRSRLPREETLVGVVAALFINLALFVVLAFARLGALPDPGAGALRLLADLLASQLATALLGPWFLALQNRALELAGVAPAALPAWSRRFD
ncbi:MAG: hypothetical protein RL376_1236 [Verrucomicrobiota bacterium]|jgi:rod shape-determining protein MreD